ncbi:unnamed protein product [Schistosoma margrebowiei]|uniref:Dynein light chain n=1 Tax=Schistosoma margrebowiei TaxID=48269 RepID=A0AA84ZR41_9TREM|nr:unnamed protein product [Schistosoma margrebowiei]
MSSTTKKIEQMQQHAIELSLEAMNLFSSHDDIADYIAKTFKETYSGCWECKVGTTFGSLSMKTNDDQVNCQLKESVPRTVWFIYKHLVVVHNVYNEFVLFCYT